MKHGVLNAEWEEDNIGLESSFEYLPKKPQISEIFKHGIASDIDEEHDWGDAMVQVD